MTRGGGSIRNTDARQTQPPRTAKSSSTSGNRGGARSTPGGTPATARGDPSGAGAGAGAGGTPSSAFASTPVTAHQAGDGTDRHAPCLMCNTDVYYGDVALECDLCSNFIHQMCPNSTAENFSMAFYGVVGQEGEDSVAYFCPHCKGRKGEVFAVYREFTDYKQHMETKINEMDGKISQMDEKLR